MIDDIGESSFTIIADGWHPSDMLEETKGNQECENMDSSESGEANMNQDDKNKKKETLGIIGAYIDQDFDICFSLLRFSFIANQKVETIKRELSLSMEELDPSQLLQINRQCK